MDTNSVNDILAEDIPPILRQQLKTLAGQLAGAIVDTLGGFLIQY